MEDIPALYPENYSFTRGSVRALTCDGFRASLKAAILVQQFGYVALRDRVISRTTMRLAGLISEVPAVRRKAGTTVRHLSFRRGGRLLDVGCGNGQFLHLMRSLGWQVEGLEPDPKAANIAREQGFAVVQTTIEQAECPSAGYDAVTLSHVAEHLREPRIAIQKILGWLNPEGILISISPNPIGLLSRLFKGAWYGLDPPRHLVLPSPTGYRQLCEPLGFEVRTWTSMQSSFWSLRESLSICRTGSTGACQARILPTVASVLGSAVLLVLPWLGDEVICYAVKK